MVDPSDGLDGLDPGEGGRPDATEVDLVPVGEQAQRPPPAGTSSLNRKHVAMAAAAILASAIFISRAGEEVPTATALRTADFSGPELTAVDDEKDDDDADERRRNEVSSWLEDEDAEAVPFDDELALGEEDLTVNTFDDFFDDSFSELDDFDDFDDFDDDEAFATPPRRPSSPRPSRPATTVRRTTTTSSTTTTTPVEETTTSTSTTTTTSTTTSTSTSTTTSTVPVAKWESATTPLTCVAPVNVWVRNDLLVASIGTKLFTSTDAGRTWTERHRGDAGAFAPVAAVQHPATRDRFWVANADGVFEATDSRAPLVEVGDLTNVRSLAVESSDAQNVTLLAAAGTASTLYRWTSTSPDVWMPLAPLPPAARSELVVLDDGRVLLGTETEVFQLADNELSWDAVFVGGVTGAPINVNRTYYWLLADGRVLPVVGDPPWTPVAATGSIRPNGTTGLTHVTGRGLVTTGGSGLIASADGGQTWTAFTPAPPYGPMGVAHSTADRATFVWRSDCAAGSTASTFIMRLADAGS